MAPMPPSPEGLPAVPAVSVLVVDDDEDTRNSTVALLNAFGVRARAARDGEEALQLLTEVKPDLILCDLQMPRLDGFGFVKRLRRTRPFHRTLTVAVTGLAGPFDTAATREAGFDGHLVKPISPAMIARLLDRAVLARLQDPPRGA
jgi:CheY-like chemotaxis protein